jgi:hypothetical protein
MKTYTSKSYWVKIYIAGPMEMIEQCCREFVLPGGCVNITPNKYIYTHGEETGAIIEIIEYPKYPSDENSIRDKAIDLAQFIMEQLHQGSYTVMDNKQVITYDRRKN